MTLPLRFVPILESVHVYLNGQLQDRTEYAIDTFSRVVANANMDVRPADRLECRYAHEGVQPGSGLEKSTILAALGWSNNPMTAATTVTVSGVTSTVMASWRLGTPFKESGTYWVVPVTYLGSTDNLTSASLVPVRAEIWGGLTKQGQVLLAADAATPGNSFTGRLQFTQGLSSGLLKDLGLVMTPQNLAGAQTAFTGVRSMWNMTPLRLREVGEFYLGIAGTAMPEGAYVRGAGATSFSMHTYADDGVAVSDVGSVVFPTGNHNVNHVRINNSPQIAGSAGPGFPPVGTDFYHQNLEPLAGAASGGSSDHPFFGFSQSTLNNGWSGFHAYYRQGAFGDLSVRGRVPLGHPGGSLGKGTSWHPLQLDFLPIAGSVRVFLNNVERPVSEYDVDAALALVQLKPGIGSIGDAMRVVYSSYGTAALPMTVARVLPYGSS